MVPANRTPYAASNRVWIWEIQHAHTMSAPYVFRSSSQVGCAPHHTSMSFGCRGAIRTYGASAPHPNKAWYPGSVIPVRYRKLGSCRNRALPSIPFRVCATPPGTYTRLPVGRERNTASRNALWSGVGSGREARRAPEGVTSVVGADAEARTTRDGIRDDACRDVLVGGVAETLVALLVIIANAARMVAMWKGERKVTRPRRARF